MCGVVGFWNRNGLEADKRVVERMVDSLRHRGPDDQGIWAHQDLGMGLSRLAILDLSTKGHQPYISDDGQGVISYNGEVYNYQEIRGHLEKEGVFFQSTSDTEVVLKALHQWGPEKAVPLFNGMFALAYFDRRNHTLWLIRDRAGIKPLYIARNGMLCVFASEMKTLFLHPSISCRPDMHALTTQIIYGRLAGNWTPFEGVQSVVPGTLLKLTREKDEKIIYFDLLRDLQVDRIQDAKNKLFADQVQEFEKLFHQSVKSHLISDAPLATMCSGGLDSSLLTGYAKEHQSDIVAYVAEVEGLAVSEAKKAEKVCQHLGLKLRRIKINREKYLREWPKAAYYNDQPNFFPQNVLFMIVCQAARDDGFKVLLTGEGADELFGGYPWCVEAHKMWKIRRIHSRLIPNIKPFRMIGRYVSRLSPLDITQLMKQPFKHLTEMSPLQIPMAQAAAVDGGQRSFREEALFEKLKDINPIEERAFLARSFEDYYSHLRTLLRANDKMGMAVSIEARVPFLENQLMDFGIHLNCAAKYSKKQTKRIVKAAAEVKLPYDIVHAKKIGFGIPDNLWHDAAPLLKGGITSEFFKWDGHESKIIQKAVEGDKRFLFRLLSVEMWGRIYFRKEAPDELGEKLLRLS